MPYILTSWFASPSLPFHTSPPWTHDPWAKNRRFPLLPSSPDRTVNLTDPSFTRLAQSVKKDLENLTTRADELHRLCKRCDDLYDQAKEAQRTGEYDRTVRRLKEAKGVLMVIDGEWKERGWGKCDEGKGIVRV